MRLALDPLPYPYDALEPFISSQTLYFHYDKHYRSYAESLEQAIEADPGPTRTLEEWIVASDGSLRDYAAQVWNHAFYWRGLSPTGGGEPTGMLLDVLTEAFGSVDRMKQELAEAANSEFGSGWAWLVRDKYGRLKVQKSSDARSPLEQGYTPLFTIDVWEHAYYLDYQSERDRYVENVLDRLMDWKQIEHNLGVPDAKTVQGWEEEDRRNWESEGGPADFGAEPEDS